MNITNWDGLRFFLAAAETGSISSAARLLDANQSTVSRHIDALEKTLGEKLFQRSVKGLSFTAKGQAVFEQAQLIQQSINKIQQPSPDDNGEVRVGNVHRQIDDVLDDGEDEGAADGG